MVTMGDLFKAMFGVIAGPLIVLAGLGLMVFVFSLFNISLAPILSILFVLSPIWLPVVLFYILYEQWISFARAKFAFEQGRTTLRIKLPQEVFKSPEAMESVFAQIHQPNGCDNLWQAYVDGKHPLISSFELVSIGGDVRFYANVPTKKVKNALEAQLYAQYPGIEVTEELIDYAAEVVWDPEKINLMSFHIVKKDADILPIKTYIDFGLDKMPKEEEKFEPMSPLLEHLCKAAPHERLYVQILCKPHAKKNFKTGDLQESGTWEKDGVKKINDIMGRDEKRMGPEENDNRPVVTTAERDTATAIERNIGKYAYSVGIRAMYITLDKDKFNGEMIGPMLKSFSQYDILNRNGLAVRYKTEFDHAWFEDMSGAKQRARKKDELEAYKRREYDPGSGKQAAAHEPKVLSVEELATIYHIPGSTIVSPNVSRVESNRREAPANLPTGNLPT